MSARVFVRAMSWALACFATVCLYGQPSVLTWHNDNARTGQNLAETILTPANVNSATFGKLFVLSVDGKVDAQPLYVPSLTVSGAVHNVLYVATEHDSVYAFDADTGTLLWQVSMLEMVNGVLETSSDDRGCSQVTPEIGITATPVIDPASGPHGTIYLIAMTKDSSGNYHHRLHALDLTTHAEEFGGPIEVSGSVSGTGAEDTFLPAQHKERPGLLLLNGVVYTSWGSHCDAGPYTGWVFGYNETTLAKVTTINLTPNGSDGGIWNAGSGPAADANGNIFLLTGNGTFDTTLNGSGFPSKGDYGNAFVKMSTNGGLAVTDYFTMDNTTSESNGDTDLGSGGLMLLPPLTGTGGTQVSLAVGAGKDTNLYVVNQANLGKFSSSADTIYQQLSGVLPGGIWSSPAWFNGTLYYGSVGSTLMAFTFASKTAGLFPTVPTSQSPTSFGYPGTTPSISANGTSNGIVWAAESASNAVLHAYDATNVSHELYNSTQAANSRDQFGSGNKYIVPTIVNGKVYVGTTNGVGVFGLLAIPPPAPVLTAPANAATGVSVTPTLTWNAATGATSYDVYFGTSSTPPLVTNVSGTTYNPGTLGGNTTYFWKIAAKNAGGSTASTIWSFTTLAAAPAAPVLTTPANASTSQLLTSTLNWTAASGATSYDVYFGTASTPPLATNVTVTTYSPGTLTANTKYYWKIVAKNTAGSTSSAVWSFTTQSSTPGGVVSPAAGTQLPVASATFSWNPVAGADQYWLDVGSQLGVGDYFGQATTGTSIQVTTLPCDGRTVYVQLWTHLSGAWQTPVRSTYSAAGGCAALTAPANNTTFFSTTEVFSWPAASGADQYWLDVGNSLREGDIFGGSTTGTAITVQGIPCDGRKIYVQLWTHLNGVWKNPGEYSYTAVTSSCGVTSPAEGSTLTSPAQVFSWGAVSGSDEYWLDVGSQVGSGNYFGEAITGTSITVDSMPCDGRTIYVQLWPHIAGNWQPPQRTTYTAASGCAALTSPANGAAFTSPSATFNWTAAAGADQYWLDVGNTQGVGDIFGGATTSLSTTVSNLPCDGRTIYVQLWTHISGAWKNPGRYQFTAWNACGKLTTPAPGSTLTGSSLTFDWTAGTGVTAYWLDVGTMVGQGNIFGANVGTATSQMVTGIPTTGQPIYVQLWSMIGGVWHLNRYMYAAAP